MERGLHMSHVGYLSISPNPTIPATRNLNLLEIAR